MAVVQSLANRFRRSTFRRQLTLTAALGIVCVTLLTALLSAWQGSRQIRATQVEQGIRLAQSLAAQSRLALLVSAQENMEEAVAAALAFPDVVDIEVWHADGRILLHRSLTRASGGPRGGPAISPVARLEAETADAWRFVAPVLSVTGADSPFDTTEAKSTTLGYVRVTQSKVTVTRLVAEVFSVNLAVGLFCALIFLFLLRLLAKRLTRPLAELAATMEQAEGGQTGLRARLEGPRDLYHMAHAFNSMMEALEERESELRTARDSALRFARLKADFAATVSHEIRTPLNGVIGTLDMLKAGNLGGRDRELLDLAWDSSQYLLELINNILDFSKLEAGKLEPEKAIFDLHALVGETVLLFQPQAESQRLTLTSRIAEQVPRLVSGDPARIRQLLTNLIGNALKFTATGGIAVTVDADGADRVRMTVADTGIGIAKEDQARIFDSFTQADTSTTRRFGGSGLGLAICKQLVRVLGGEIGVESFPGHGSRFWFVIPCPVAKALPIPAEGPAPAPVGHRTAPRILVAEDNRTNQVVAEGMLQMLGCHCQLAANGREAVKAWREAAWDLVLMDCNMPDMDGFEATALIRSEEARGQRLTIIAMTANSMPTDIEKCLAAGMDGHLSKPLTLESLAACLERWLQWHAPVPPVQDNGDKGSAPLDMAVLERLREALGPAVGEAIRPFVEDMPTYVARLEEAVNTGDAAVLRQTAHAIKGAASNLGAGHLAAVAREMEVHAEAGALAEAADLLVSLRTEYALVEPLLTAELDLPAVMEPLFRDDDAPRVLIVDDDRSTRSALRHALRRGGFVVDEARDGVEVLLKLETSLPDAILMDALMPELDGFATCAELKRHALWKDIPVLMITALEDRPSIERAFEAGASDFIPKPIHLSVVNRRVRRVIDANRAERQVRHLAYNDPLTGLANRRLFLENAERSIERAEAHQGRLAVLFLDLDRFKNVNDTLGHECGDQLLAIVGQRIKGCVRADDCVARLGGDEFAVVLDNLPNIGVASGVAQNIARMLSGSVELAGQEIVATASIGISIYPDDGRDVSTLLRHADTAMYRAKQGGLGVAFYEAAMEAAVADRLRLENALRRALERDEIAVFYQPVVAADGAISSVEALVRWRHPERGIVSPAEFITVAEDTGLILQLGERVLRMACAQARAWLDDGLRVRMAVNLSGKQLQQAELPEVVASALADSGLPAELLVLEITESVLMERAHEPVEMLHRLRSLGVRVAIDDFGTGYSSLAYLKRFPIDYLKIDRSFVQDLPDDPDAVAIATGIVALAHSLRLKVIAEGVETPAQRDLLTQIGCDYQQGYYYARPLPADVASSHLLAHAQERAPAKKMGKA